MDVNFNLDLGVTVDYRVLDKDFRLLSLAGHDSNEPTAHFKANAFTL